MAIRDEIVDVAYVAGSLNFPSLPKLFYKWLVLFTIKNLKQEVPMGKDGLPTTETAEVRRFNDRIQKIADGVI